MESIPWNSFPMTAMVTMMRMEKNIVLLVRTALRLKSAINMEGGSGTEYEWSMTGLIISCAALAMFHYADSKSGRGGDWHDDGPETADCPFSLQRDRPSRNRSQ